MKKYTFEDALKHFNLNKNTLEQDLSNLTEHELYELIKMDIHEFNEMFKGDPNVKYRRLVLYNTYDMDVVKSFLDDPNETLRTSAEHIINIGKPFQRISKEELRGERNKSWDEFIKGKKITESINKKDLNDLINDDSDFAINKLSEVIRGGDLKTLKFLLDNDKRLVTRYGLAKRNEIEILKHLVYDDDPRVRREVAKHGIDPLTTILKRDKSDIVRKEAMKHKAV